MKRNKIAHHLSKLTRVNMLVALVVSVAVAGVGYMLIMANAAGLTAMLESESGDTSGSAKVVADENASGGQAIRFGASDSAASETPTGLRAVTGGNNIALQWKISSSAAEITSYNVYRDNQKIATVTPDQSNYITQTGTRYYDGDVSGGQTYQYRVAAISTGGVESEKSAAVAATQPQSTTPVPDVTYGLSEATDLQSYVDQFVKPTVNTWYPKIADYLVRGQYAAHTSFQIIFDKDYEGVARVEGGQKMRVNPQWVRDHPADMGMFVHEMTHIVQSYQGAPGVITEGMADWTREYMMRDREPRPPRDSETYLDGYSPGSYFLNWIQTTQNKPSFIHQINVRAHSNGVDYGIFAELTGKPVQQLWYEMTGRKLSGVGPVKLQGQNRCADIQNFDTANGTVIQVVDCKNNAAQQWVHIYNNNESGAGPLKALGKCMDVDRSGTANGTKVQLWDCNGSNAQDWQVRSDGSLYNPHSGKCLQPRSGSTALGTPLEIYTCNGSAAQHWSVPTY